MQISRLKIHTFSLKITISRLKTNFFKSRTIFLASKGRTGNG